MLFILRNRTRKKLVLSCRIIVTIFILSLVFSHLYNMYSDENVIREGWLRDDRPSGNPMRVENIEKTVKNNDPGVFDQFVVKLRDFYQRDE